MLTIALNRVSGNGEILASAPCFGGGARLSVSAMRATQDAMGLCGEI